MTRQRKSRDGARGFTLLELMIVITIISILAAISVGRYEQSILRAREAALRQDLAEMRKAIQNYTLDKEAGPASLDDLRASSYIGDVPIDPITHQKDWYAVQDCNDVMSPEQTFTGVCDVHSSSDQISSEGTPYSSW